MPQYDVRVWEVQSIRLLTVPRRATPAQLATTVPEACGAVWNALRGQNQRGGRNVAIYWDGEVRLDAGVEFDGTFVSEECHVTQTPAGLAASVVHFGPYAQLGAAHDAVRQWCRANDYEAVGANWEIYGHWQAEWDRDPSQIRTDVYYQVSRRAG
jgi:effector-binding domain-containing protein